MAIGRTFKESFQKALRGLEVGSFGFGCDSQRPVGYARATLARRNSSQARHAQRRPRLVSALRLQGRHVGRRSLRADGHRSAGSSTTCWRSSSWRASCASTSGLGIGAPTNCSNRPSSSAFPTGSSRRFGACPNRRVRAERKRLRDRGDLQDRSTPAPPNSKPTRLTTIPPTKTRTKRRAKPEGGRRIMILGGGPNRIGQGIEFDYCCCHAASPCASWGSRRSWSTRTPKRSAPITTPATCLFFEP